MRAMTQAAMSELAQWNSFYVVVGSSAGVLIALQFIVRRPPCYFDGRGQAGHRARRSGPFRGEGLPRTIFFSSSTARFPPPPWRPPPPAAT